MNSMYLYADVIMLIEAPLPPVPPMTKYYDQLIPSKEKWKKLIIN